jgi:hypothetical protein
MKERADNKEEKIGEEKKKEWHYYLCFSKIFNVLVLGLDTGIN